MKIRFGIALALAVGLSIGAPVAPVGAQQQLAQGERPRATTETRAAEKALKEGDEAKDEASARASYEQALTAAQAGITKEARNPLAYLLAANAALALERYAEAAQYFDQAETLRPIYKIDTQRTREATWIDLYNQAAPLLSQPSTYAEAAAIFENANTIHSTRPELYLALGQLYSALDQVDKAVERLDQAYAIATAGNPDLDAATAAQWAELAKDAQMTKAATFVQANRHDDAIVVYREMAAQDPSNLALTRDMATLLVQAGKQEEAFRVYEQLLARSDLTFQDYYGIGIGYYQGSVWDRAGAAFVKAAELSPKDRDALELAADALQRDSAYAEVIPLAERWQALDPNNRGAYLIHAQAARGLGNDALTLELVNKIGEFSAEVEGLGLRRQQPGGGRVNGTFVNKKLAAGTRVTLTFTFYDAQGSAIGTQATNVTAGEPDVGVGFSVEFVSETPVGGYGYTLQAM